MKLTKFKLFDHEINKIIISSSNHIFVRFDPLISLYNYFSCELFYKSRITVKELIDRFVSRDQGEKELHIDDYFENLKYDSIERIYIDSPFVVGLSKHEKIDKIFNYEEEEDYLMT